MSVHQKNKKKRKRDLQQWNQRNWQRLRKIHWLLPTADELRNLSCSREIGHSILQDAYAHWHTMQMMKEAMNSAMYFTQPVTHEQE